MSAPTALIQCCSGDSRQSNEARNTHTHTYTLKGTQFGSKEVKLQTAWLPKQKILPALVNEFSQGASIQYQYTKADCTSIYLCCPIRN